MHLGRCTADSLSVLKCSLRIAILTNVDVLWAFSGVCHKVQVLRVALPRTPTPLNVSPPRRIGPDFHSTQQPPLQRCGSGYAALYLPNIPTFACTRCHTYTLGTQVVQQASYKTGYDVHLSH